VDCDQTLAGASGQDDLRVRSRRRKPSEGVMALFGPWARGVSAMVGVEHLRGLCVHA
jgi:hypothetical protein